jgi:hypothetical protein
MSNSPTTSSVKHYLTNTKIVDAKLVRKKYNGILSNKY